MPLMPTNTARISAAGASTSSTPQRFLTDRPGQIIRLVLDFALSLPVDHQAEPQRALLVARCASAISLPSLLVSRISFCGVAGGADAA